MRNTLILSILLAYSMNTFALDMGSWKKKLRGFSNKVLGEKTTSKYFGAGNNDIKLGPIPNVVADSKSTYTLDKNNILFKQGEEFNKMSVEKKRPYRIAFLEELFEATRKQKVEDEEIIKWLNTMEQGSSREGVYRALVLDNVYRSLENFEDFPAIEVVKFTEKIYKKFVNRVIKGDSLRRLNLYSIKRVVTEKFLDIMEAYESDPEGLYKWYAVLSSDLAKQFNYKNKLRDDRRAKIHHDWAQTVPYQHIKAEVIIKLHMGYNTWLK
jgi:hypothetical protein